MKAVGDGTLTIANALGNGIADDKAIYAYVPAMIEYYLGERPHTGAGADVDLRRTRATRLRARPSRRAGGQTDRRIRGHRRRHRSGGDAEALEARRRELQAQPERFIAQEAIALSTHPTFDGEGMYPHHVDLRAFVHLRLTGRTA